MNAVKHLQINNNPQEQQVIWQGCFQDFLAQTLKLRYQGWIVKTKMGGCKAKLCWGMGSKSLKNIVCGFEVNRCSLGGLFKGTNDLSSSRCVLSMNYAVWNLKIWVLLETTSWFIKKIFRFIKNLLQNLIHQDVFVLVLGEITKLSPISIILAQT